MAKKKDEVTTEVNPENERVPAVETQGEVLPPLPTEEVAAALDQVDHDDDPLDQPHLKTDDEHQAALDERLKRADPPNAQQTEPPGVVSGETAGEAAAKRVEGQHMHDEDIGWEHRGPVLVDAPEHLPEDKQKM